MDTTQQRAKERAEEQAVAGRAGTRVPAGINAAISTLIASVAASERGTDPEARSNLAAARADLEAKIAASGATAVCLTDFAQRIQDRAGTIRLNMADLASSFGMLNTTKDPLLAESMKTAIELVLRAGAVIERMAGCVLDQTPPELYRDYVVIERDGVFEVVHRVRDRVCFSHLDRALAQIVCDQINTVAAENWLMGASDVNEPARLAVPA